MAEDNFAVNCKTDKKFGLINRLILPFAPRAACQREAWRQYARSFYTAADRSPRSAGWTAANASGETANRGERDIVRARSRDLERNSDLLNMEILALERNVVGTGIMLQAKIADEKSEGDVEDDRLNSHIEELWHEWCKPGSCEITGRFSLTEIQKLCVRRRFVDGGLLIIKVCDSAGYRLQLLEVDDLDGTVQTHGENRVESGIEIDAYRKPLAYHIKVYDTWGFAINTIRVPADRVIFLANITRPSQVREFAPTAPALPRIDDVNEFIDAAVEKERVLAHLSVVVKKDGGPLTGSALGRGQRGGYGDEQSPATPPQEILHQGTVTYIKPGEEIQTVAPSGTSSTIDPLVRTTQRLAGGSAGLSYEVASRDMSQVTYSSARQGLLEDIRTYKGIQQYLIDHFFDVIYPEWLDWMVLSGRLDIPGYFRDQQKYRRHSWIASGWDWIDPLKEAAANAKGLETCQTTLQTICASRGQDWRDVVRQRAAEQAMITGYMPEKEEDESANRKKQAT